MPAPEDSLPPAWHVLVCGVELDAPTYQLTSTLRLVRLPTHLSVFDLAAAGAVGFREWAVLEPLSPAAKAEIVSERGKAASPGYDDLNLCWLVSALLVVRGHVGHMCPAASRYSWALIAGHQRQTAPEFRKQLASEGISQAIFDPSRSLPNFEGGLLDYHLKMLVPKDFKQRAFDAEDAAWIARHLDTFNELAAHSERFRFALEAAVDWRYSKDARAAIARLWAGIESLFGISSELVYRISLLAAVLLHPRGEARFRAYKRVRASYAVRSKAVHGEPISDEKLYAGMSEAFDILSSLLLNIIQRARVPTEEDLHKELLSDA